jgi:toxin ParE1/3/4
VSRSIHISRKANAEIAAAWDYTAREHGIVEADSYVAAMDRVMAMALQYPNIGSDYSEVRDGYRKLISGSHLIFYIPHDGGIEIMRVLHVREDIPARLGE